MQFLGRISYLSDIQHRGIKKCRLVVVHRWTNNLNTTRRWHLSRAVFKGLPPIERTMGGNLCRMTPAQRKQATSLIRRECCNHDNGACIALDDGDTHTCPQTISFSVCCKCFGGLSCRWPGRWKRRYSKTGTPTAAPSADKPIFLNPTGRNTARSAPP